MLARYAGATGGTVGSTALAANAVAWNAQHQAFANGGTVLGAGTSKSDSILLRASVGEETVQMPYAAKYRSELKAMDNGTYGAGGMYRQINQAPVTAPNNACPSP